MENPLNQGTRPPGLDDQMETSDVMSIVELQKFITDELAANQTSAHFEKAFTAITDGLGLESPTTLSRKTAEGAGLREALGGKPKPQTPPTPTPVVTPSKEDMPPVDSFLKQTPAVQGLEDKPSIPLQSAWGPAMVPPPMPKPGVFRRLQAVVLDQVFVLSIFCVSVLITANFLSRGNGDWLSRVAAEFGSPMFVRFAFLEYTTLWLAYLAIGIGLLDMTFGMWIWNLRVSYGTDEKMIGIRKWIRILMTFLFFAPVFPSVLLAIRLKGKNLIDACSGSHLYLSASE